MLLNCKSCLFQSFVFSQICTREVSIFVYLYKVLSVLYLQLPCFAYMKMSPYYSWSDFYFFANDRSGIVCRVKYCNSLPDIPFDPKFITYPFDQHRLSHSLIYFSYIHYYVNKITQRRITICFSVLVGLYNTKPRRWRSNTSMNSWLNQILAWPLTSSTQTLTASIPMVSF